MKLARDHSDKINGRLLKLLVEHQGGGGELTLMGISNEDRLGLVLSIYYKIVIDFARANRESVTGRFL